MLEILVMRRHGRPMLNAKLENLFFVKASYLTTLLPKIKQACDCIFSIGCLFKTRELHACARASCRYDVENGTRSLARLVDSYKLFFDFRLLSAFDSFWRVINKRNGDLCC